MNDDYYECLTPETTVQVHVNFDSNCFILSLIVFIMYFKLLDACRAGKCPKMGKWGSLPMNGQVKKCYCFLIF